jgi:hypothetical protein
MHTKFWSEYLKGRDYAQDLGTDGRIILEWILEKKEKGWKGADCSHLVRDREQLWALVNMIMNLQVP